MAGLTLRLPPLPTAPSEARHALAAWLGQRAATSVGQDALVVVSELVTNGVVHNGGDDILLWADDGDGTVDIGVLTTPLEGSNPFPRPNVEPDEVGRGMSIVAAVCQDVQVHNDDQGRRVVTCELKLD